MECMCLVPTSRYRPNEPYTRDIAGCFKRSGPCEVLYNNSEIVDNLEADVDTASSPWDREFGRFENRVCLTVTGLDLTPKL